MISIESSHQWMNKYKSDYKYIDKISKKSDVYPIKIKQQRKVKQITINVKNEILNLKD